MSLHSAKSRKNVAILSRQIVDVLFVFIHIPASVVVFLTSFFGRALRAIYCPHLRQIAAVRRIVGQLCLRLCQSNFNALFVFIEIAGCTFISNIWCSLPARHVVQIVIIRLSPLNCAEKPFSMPDKLPSSPLFSYTFPDRPSFLTSFAERQVTALV
jgi:hypothetical protein